MNDLINWLSMGGYAAYVWSAYALVFVVLLLNILGIKKQRAAVQKKLQAFFGDNQQR